MKGIKLTKRGENVLLTLEVLLIAVAMFFFIRTATNAWEKEYELNAQISAQAAENYYESLPHNK